MVSYEESVNIVKGISLIMLTCLSLIGIIPIYCMEINYNFIGLANSFSAGMFISISLIHLIPDSNDILT